MRSLQRCSEGAEAVWRAGGGLSGTLTSAEMTAPELGPDVERLALQATAPAPGVLRVHITAASAPRWEVPRWLYPADSVAGAQGTACNTPRVEGVWVTVQHLKVPHWLHPARSAASQSWSVAMS